MQKFNFPFPINELAAAMVEQLLPHIKAIQTPPAPPTEKYLTRKETAQKLNVSLPTLNAYTKRGLIVGYRFGVRVMYKQTSIEAALTNMDYRGANHA